LCTGETVNTKPRAGETKPDPLSTGVDHPKQPSNALLLSCSSDFLGEAVHIRIFVFFFGISNIWFSRFLYPRIDRIAFLVMDPMAVSVLFQDHESIR